MNALHSSAAYLRFATLLALALLAISACEAKKESGEAKTEDPPAAASVCAATGAEPELINADAEEILAAVRAPGAKAVVVNAWATWCAPCVEEFPHFVEFYREHCDDGVRLLFVSADFSKQRDDALKFLKEQGVDFRSFHKKGDEDLFINTLNPDWSGALPATFIYDGEGNRVHFIEEPMDKAQLEALVAPLLANTDNTSEKP